jgi:hypothetical protein
VALSLIRPRTGRPNDQIDRLAVRGYDQASPTVQGNRLTEAGFDILGVLIGERGNALLTGADYTKLLTEHVR